MQKKYRFDRIANGVKMAEGIRIYAGSEEEALFKAKKLLSEKELKNTELMLDRIISPPMHNCCPPRHTYC